MPVGAGKYDDLCTVVRVGAKADGALVMVFNGDKGFGFSLQANADTVAMMPELLEMMATDIRKSLEESKP